MNRGVTIFFASTTVLLALALAWVIAPRFLQTQAAQQTKPDEDIVFPLKTFLGTKRMSQPKERSQPTGLLIKTIPTQSYVSGMSVSSRTLNR